MSICYILNLLAWHFLITLLSSNMVEVLQFMKTTEIIGTGQPLPEAAIKWYYTRVNAFKLKCDPIDLLQIGKESH